MTLFKLSAIILVIIIGLACPPVLIPAAAFVWFMIDRERKHGRTLRAKQAALEALIDDRERHKAARYFAR